MKKPWPFLQNPILNCTKRSFRKAIRISIYHDAALETASENPFFEVLYDSYHLVHLALLEAYSDWKTAFNTQQGNTLHVEQLQETLTSIKIRDWDIAIQVVYNNATTEYKGILPHKRGPFQSGSQIDKLNAVKALSLALDDIETLTAIKTDVDDFILEFEEALSTQKGSMSTTDTASDELEKARVVMCVAQYANLGALIQKYAKTPHYAGNYFDLGAIRRTTQVVFTGHLKTEERHRVVKHTFKADDELTLDNPGATDLLFWLAKHKGDTQGSIVITVLAGETRTLTAKELGDLKHLYLMVQNASMTEEGEFEVEL